MANDGAALLRAGLRGGAGVVVSAGTAMIAAGRAADGRVWRTLGMSSGPGDWGGGPEIVREAVNAIARAEMGFTTPTALTRIALARTGRASVAAYLANAVRRGELGLTPDDVWDAAAGGDEASGGLADRVATSVAVAAAGVARRIGLAETQVVVAGRVLDPGRPILHGRVVEAVTAAVPGARVRQLGMRPVVGAVLMAADQVGWRLTADAVRFPG